MKKFYTVLFALTLSQLTMNAQSVNIGPKLQQALTDTSKQNHRVTLIFEDQIDYYSWLLYFESQQTSLDTRAKFILKESQALAQQQQKSLLDALGTHAGVSKIRSFWLVNMVEAEMTSRAIADFLDWPGLATIESAEIEQYGLIAPIEEQNGNRVEAINGREPGLSAIGAPALWQMGYTGRNRRAMLLDTGVWPHHPALNGRFLGDRFGQTQAWLPFDLSTPGDKPGTHGTHVVGTILGLDPANNDTIGVAMNAYYIATDPIVENIANVRPWTDLILPFQWALNPDGDTATTHDIPDVINNSWGRFLTDTLVCSGMVVQVMTAVEAAGIANVFSAGNNGPSGMTIGSPAQMSVDTLSLFSIAAIDINNVVAGFSSRGPTRCFADSRTAIKPEVSAPGVNVRSANGTNSYGLKSGTSMAAPHVSGAVLLLKEAFPELSGRSLLNALYQTATDLGSPGEDNSYGMGIINLPAAYQFLAAQFTPSPARNQGPDVAINGLMPGNTAICFPDDYNDSLRFDLQIIVENKGTTSSGSYQVDLHLNGSQQSFTINQSLASGQTDTLRLGPINRPTPGQLHPLRLRIQPLNNEIDTINNHWFDSLFVPVVSRPFISIEKFDDIARFQSGWSIENPDGDATFWDTTTQITGIDSVATAMVLPLRFSANRGGQRDYLYTPPVYFYSVFARQRPVFIKFDLAYNNRNTIFKDSLFFEINDGCGKGWRRLWASGGDSMRTYTLSIPNQAAHWRQINFTDSVLNIPGSTQSGPIRFRFVGINDQGGNIYITNFSAGSLLGSVAQSSLLNWNLYPNPAQSQLQLTFESYQKPVIEVVDLLGKSFELSTELHTSGATLDISSLTSGIYLIRLQIGDKIDYRKFIKQ